MCAPRNHRRRRHHRSLIPTTSAARVGIDTGEDCARTCVSACSVHPRGLVCTPSRTYVPFPEQGFGAFTGTPAHTSSYCGLVVKPTDPCDFLVDERCIENGAHGAEGSASPLGPEALQVNAFLRPAGDVEQFCTGPCDPN